MVKRIAITGPESTGKSMLSGRLAEEFNAAWVPEFAREYLDQLNRSYDYDDILTIAKSQFQKMQQAANSGDQFIFYDTELLVTKIWCEFKYGKCHSWILDNIEKQPVDLYLLTDIDLPWQPDPQREHPDKRNQLFNLYRTELEKLKAPFEVISGVGEQRTVNAVNAIKRRFH